MCHHTCASWITSHVQRLKTFQRVADRSCPRRKLLDTSRPLMNRKCLWKRTRATRSHPSAANWKRRVRRECRRSAKIASMRRCCYASKTSVWRVRRSRRRRKATFALTQTLISYCPTPPVTVPCCSSPISATTQVTCSLRAAPNSPAPQASTKPKRGRWTGSWGHRSRNLAEVSPSLIRSTRRPSYRTSSWRTHKTNGCRASS